MAEVRELGTGGGGLGTGAARWALSAVWALGVLHMVLNGRIDPLDPRLLAAHTASLLGAFLLTAPGDRVLDRPRAIAVAAASLTTAVLVYSLQPPLEYLYTYNFGSYLVALLLVRGNVLVAGIGSGLYLVSGWCWALLRPDATVTGVVSFMAVPTAALITGIIWLVSLARTVAAERERRLEEAEARLAADLADQAAARDRRELAEISGELGPLLLGIARGDPLDARVHRELRIAEATIRDRLRAPWSLHPVLAAAIAERRRAGVEVLLLGERAEPNARIRDELAAAIVAIIGAVEYGAVTIRAVPRGRGPAISVLVESADRVDRLELAENGTAVPAS